LEKAEINIEQQMAAEAKVKIKGEETVTAAAESAGDAVERLERRMGKAGKGAKKDWAGIGDLFSQFLPRGFQRTIRSFKSTQRQIGRLSRGFKSLRGAIAATGIGAFVVALGAIVDNWDKISEAITGASDATKDAVTESEKLVKASKEQLDNISATENILRLQGKTEEDILMMRMQATDEAIMQQKILIDNLKAQKEEETAAADRVTKYTKAIIGLVTFPLTAALGIIDTISAGLAEIGVLEEGTSLAEGYVSGVAGMLFDPPEEVAEKADETIDAAEAQLQRLENTRAGYALRQQANEEKQAEEARRKQEQIDKQRIADEKFVQDQLLKLQQDYEIRSLDSADAQAKKRLEMQFDADYLELVQRGATYDALLALARKFDMDIAEIDANAAKRKSDLEAQVADQLYERSLSNFERQEMALMSQYDRMIEMAGDNAELIAQINAAYIEDYEQLVRDSADEEENIQLRKIDALANATSGLFRTMGQMAEDNSKQQKNLAVADVLLNQAMAMAGAIRGATESAKDPISLATFIVSMLGTVLGSFVQVKQIMDQAGGASGGVGRGGGQTRSGFSDMSVTPLPARLDTPDMQAYVVQSQLQGQNAMAQQLNNKITL
jgi:hypothetical protein|tara:strand:+ start:10429 stop:12261 length:1833 start_codon:yes stop_codon:yes gene_type:complete